jgi:putrescine transport system substrate-binding protein
LKAVSRATGNIRLGVLVFLASLALGCSQADTAAKGGHAEAGGGDKGTLNLYIWSDYLGPDTIASFEKLTGIKVRVSYFDTDEALETRMLTGNSGFDVVFPTAIFFQRQIRSGAYLALDRSRLPNFKNLEPGLMSRVTQNDPGNVHGVVYMWGTNGIGYNEKMVAEALPNTPLDSWRLVFDPSLASKLAKCGISMIDSPDSMMRHALEYLGRNPNAPSAQDLADVEALFAKIRPYVRNIDSAGYIEAMANGDICVAVGYSGDFVQARNRALEAKNGIKISYVVPKEGSELWFSMVAIPKDAPNPENAHLFINYLMDPQVIANISNFIGYANANAAATPLLKASMASDSVIYPPADQQQRLFVAEDSSPEQSRRMTRIWQKFKTSQ